MGLKSNWLRRLGLLSLLGEGTWGEPQSTGGVPMRMGGEPPLMLVREELLPVWCVLMVKALCLGS